VSDRQFRAAWLVGLSVLWFQALGILADDGRHGLSWILAALLAVLYPLWMALELRTLWLRRRASRSDEPDVGAREEAADG
jgi:hypothetical protein